MELLWRKPKCDKCKHKSHPRYPSSAGGREVGWDCKARQTAIHNNPYINRLGNCWYFEKK